MIPIPPHGIDLPALPDESVIRETRMMISRDDKTKLAQFDVMIARMRLAAFHNSPGGKLIDNTSGRN